MFTDLHAFSEVLGSVSRLFGGVFVGEEGFWRLAVDLGLPQQALEVILWSGAQS